MERQTKSIFKKILAASATMLFLAIPAGANAQVVFGYVDAWQALNANSRFHGKTIAQLIYDESTEHNINPRLLLTILQRESSAVTKGTPSSLTTQTWPMFYMYNERMADCLNGDEASCNDANWPTSAGSATYYQRAYDFGGVGQQIAYATYNFDKLFTNNSSSYSTPISIDGQTITPANIATKVLYSYTPHICAYNDASNDSCPKDSNGNVIPSAFYSRWVEWWGGTPNGGAYDANNILTDANYRNNSPMSAEEINNFLVAKGSWMANYVIPEYISVPYPMVYTAPVTPPPPPPRKAGDGNGDGAVDSTDLSILADSWGKGVLANTGADFNGDGVVDSTDLSILADAWGK